MNSLKYYAWTVITIPGILLISSCTAKKIETQISGELRQWHKVTLTVNGPFANESDTSPNPFLDYRMTVAFTHESGSPSYLVPGYFAADGNAANSSAASGNKWRAHLSPDKPGRWNYEVSIVARKNIAVDNVPADKTRSVCRTKGSFDIQSTNKSGRDFRGKGRLQYVGERYLQFAGTKEYFLKAGADSPENLLAYEDIDGTYSNKKANIIRDNEAPTSPLKTWQSHISDWHPGDPTWKDGKGKGLIGALNYLAGKGCNSFSFLTYNAGGDGDDVWPFIRHDDKLHYDCSKLDQWQIEGGTTELDLGRDTASFRVLWFNPRKGGMLQDGDLRLIKGSGITSLGKPPVEPDDDWIILVRKQAFFENGGEGIE